MNDFVHDSGTLIWGSVGCIGLARLSTQSVHHRAARVLDKKRSSHGIK